MVHPNNRHDRSPSGCAHSASRQTLGFARRVSRTYAAAAHTTFFFLRFTSAGEEMPTPGPILPREPGRGPREVFFFFFFFFLIKKRGGGGALWRHVRLRLRNRRGPAHRAEFDMRRGLRRLPSMSDRKDDELGILARADRGGDHRAVYDEMGKAIGEAKAREILRNAIAARDRSRRRDGVARARRRGPRKLQGDPAPVDEGRRAPRSRCSTTTPGVLDFNVRRCRYAETYRAMGLGDIGDMLSCNRNGGLLRGLRSAHRTDLTQTIMGGPSHCDFRYRSDPPRRASRPIQSD